MQRSLDKVLRMCERDRKKRLVSIRDRDHINSNEEARKRDHSIAVLSAVLVGRKHVNKHSNVNSMNALATMNQSQYDNQRQLTVLVAICACVSVYFVSYFFTSNFSKWHGEKFNVNQIT